MKKLVVALIALSALLYAATNGLTAGNAVTAPAKTGSRAKPIDAQNTGGRQVADAGKQPDVAKETDTGAPAGAQAGVAAPVKSGKPASQDKIHAAGKNEDKPVVATATVKGGSTSVIGQKAGSKKAAKGRHRRHRLANTTSHRHHRSHVARHHHRHKYVKRMHRRNTLS